MSCRGANKMLALWSNDESKPSHPANLASTTRSLRDMTIPENSKGPLRVQLASQAQCGPIH